MRKFIQSSQPQRWLHLLSLAMALLGMLMLYRFTARPVTISIDGESDLIRTHSRQVGDLIADRGIHTDPADRINFPASEPVRDGMLIEITRARDVLVETPEEKQIVHSAATSPANILQDLGIRIFPGDELWINGIERVQPAEQIGSTPESIRLEAGKRIGISIDGSLNELHSSEPTVGAALIESGMTLFEGDRVEPVLSTALQQDMQIEIKRARPIIIRMNERELPVQSAGETVGEVLIDAGIGVGGLDYTSPGLEEPTPQDGVVRIVRVEEDVLVELEPLPFETVYQPVDSLELDQLQVQNQGRFGVQAERIRIRYEDGVEVSRSTEEAVAVVEPESRVIGYGTKIVVRTLNTGYGTIEYWRAVPVYATSYSPCRLGVDRCGFVTAAGTGVDRGTVGVIRSWFRVMRGWPVFVPGYGPGSIQDIGAGFSDRDWIDLGFTDEEYEAWHDWTTLYFLTPVPPLDQIPWILP